MEIHPAGTPPLSEPGEPKKFDKELKARQLERLSEWEGLYKSDYVAHGIVRANEHAVLEDGFLRCGESVLRREGRLEFEGGAMAGHREVVRLPQQEINPKLLEPLKAKIIELFDMSDEDIEVMIRDIEKSRNPEEAFLASLKSLAPTGFNLNRAATIFEDIIIKLVQLRPNLWKEGERPRDIYINPLVAIFVDKALPKDSRCKAQLARVFAIYERLVKEKKVDVTLPEIGALLGRIRRVRLLDPGKINQEIRVYRNHHVGCYGSVRVLIGGVQGIIGSEQVPQTGEYCLLGVGQNKGKFFKVDLASSNILILGPESSLAAYAENHPFSKNIVFTENVPK